MVNIMCLPWLLKITPTMLSRVRSVTTVSRYLLDVPVNGFIKHCMASQGCFKTFLHYRMFCATITPETEFDNVNKVYENINTSPDVEKRIKMILLECELTRQIRLMAPSCITEADMKELLELKSLHARRKYFHYLKSKELDILGEKRKKEKKQLEYQMKVEEQTKQHELTGHLRYGLNGNTFFMYIRKKALHAFHVSRLCRAAMTEQPLVFDMDFEDDMNKREIVNAAEQIRDSYGFNKRSSEPFDICFCNLKPESELMFHLKHSIPNINSASSMITVEDRSYLDLYPKEKLVYLTPNASESLQDYDSDKIYIIGGVVDKKNENQLTLAKAKRDGIKAAKLPLDEYLLWGVGQKSLTINQVMLILLEWKKTNDWNKALRFVPTRKLKKAEDYVVEQERQIEKFQTYKQKKVPNEYKIPRGKVQLRSLFDK